MRRAAPCIVASIGVLSVVTAGEIALPDRITTAPPFSAQGTAETYDADRLYEYIDGGADVYIDAGMKRCTVRLYGLSGIKTALFEVAAYAMGSDVQAFGIFRQLQSSPTREIGVESAVSPRRIAFWKSAFYVEVLDKSPKPADGRILTALARKVAELVPGESRLPRETELLPDSLKISGSERYWKSGFLSRSFLNNVISAEYRRKNAAPCTLFVMICANDSAAVAGLDAITDAYEEEVPRVKAFASKNRIGGCVGCTKREHETVLFGVLLQGLRGK